MNAHPCHLIASALPPKLMPEPPCATIEGLCAVTGNIGPCLPRKLVILDTNTDGYLFVEPTSQLVHVDVYTSWAFGTLKEGAKKVTCPERQSCWWTDGREFKRLMKKTEMRPYVLEGSPTTPWAMWITTSYKKHGSVRTKANSSHRGVIGFDDLMVDVSNKTRVHEYWYKMRAAQNSGIQRPLIEKLDIKPAYMQKIGWKLWKDFEDWAKVRSRSPLYKLVCYLLPSMEEIQEGFSYDPT